MKIEKYFPSENRSVSLGDNITWYVNVYNQMEKLEYLSVKFKLINSTHGMPDDNLHVPSNGIQIFEARQVVVNNSTFVIPVNWTNTGLENDRENGYIKIKSLNINGMVLENLDIKSKDGEDFRMIIELSRYDPETKNLSFTWFSEGETRSAWNQIWFSVKA